MNILGKLSILIELHTYFCINLSSREEGTVTKVTFNLRLQAELHVLEVKNSEKQVL